ncbi:MAG: chromosome segregation protein SMC [Pirellulaceae bacterium]|nr:chromosome segregation protein SMC [Pirellulaceae bacterium]
MLIALELAGFKSFADKTRFDFPDGITVVVGPNGSGKSNIVDAIKWVLGTQSAKSLRGDDMADVIFKGSAAGGRKPCNSAEATLILDNKDKRLAVDAPEVHVTRRVYRSGESEYLINRQPCRLKDIKDLFRGTGVGIDAYSLIEQGKVDRMLQASSKDRRAIFEDAAGISRFKSKKVETERRIQRVDQNLVRLKDIVDEVYTRLSNLKNQAAKAQQYREMTARVSVLRLQLGIDERSTLLTKSEQLNQALATNIENRTSLSEQLTAAAVLVEQSGLRLAEQLGETQTAQTEQQTWREKIAGLESFQTALRERLIELVAEREIVTTRQTALEEKADLTAEEVTMRVTEVQELRVQHESQANRVRTFEQDRLNLDDQLTRLHQALDAQRERIKNLDRQSHQSSALSIAESTRVAQLERQLASQLQQLEHFSATIDKLEREQVDQRTQRGILESQAAAAQLAFSTAKAELESHRLQHVSLQETAIVHQGRLQGTRERLLLLEQLEDQLEGVGRGAKRLLEIAANDRNAPWSSVKGLVADLIEIDVHLAPLIDVALGASAETVVLEDGQVIDLLRDGTLNLDGRVSMLRIDRLPSRRAGDKIQLDGLRGVLGRADRLVHTQPEFTPLVHYLLGTTWLVDTLATALDLSHLRGAGLRFVTAECERIDADGTLSIGSLQTALGLVSRRSEMLAARDEIRHLEELTTTTASALAAIQSTVHDLSVRLKELDEAARSTDLALTEFSVQQAANATRIDELKDEHRRLGQEIDETREQLSASLVVVAAAEVAAQTALGELQTLQVNLLQQLDQVRSLEEQRRAMRETITSEKIVLARIDQRLEGLQATLDQLNRDASERQQAVIDAQASIAALDAKTATTEKTIQEADLQRVQLIEQVDASQVKLAALLEVTNQLQVERQTASRQHDQHQRQLDRSIEQQRSLETELAQCRSRIDELVRRYQQDYQLDLLDASFVEQTPKLVDRQAAEAEVSQLRQDIASVGSVNMEALRELDELQSRYDKLHGHYVDLTDAKQNLQNIVAKINEDSQRLFSETLEAIRKNFQELYRRSFGGGHADLILEQCEDMSEAGVEIVATPPGKTALSNSLLSGGEKALTAVALIMSIFQFRPSPFCILDEVDAPFDEANIGRFVSVLTEFLDMTKFVVVSHSKKTMTAANTIYGITMQESGVSRQVSVRFEDVRDDEDFLAGDQPSNKAA